MNGGPVAQSGKSPRLIRQRVQVGVWDTGYAVVQIRPGPSTACTILSRQNRLVERLRCVFSCFHPDFRRAHMLELNHLIDVGRRRLGLPGGRWAVVKSTRALIFRLCDL